METQTKNKDYTTTITVNATPAIAFEKIAQVGGWWAKVFTGKALQQGDTFKVQFGETTVDFKVTEATPGNKIVWLVTDSFLHWQSAKTEWTGTKIIWEIDGVNNTTQIKMSHLGLVPGLQSYEGCKEGWTKHVTVSLVHFINENKGEPY